MGRLPGSRPLRFLTRASGQAGDNGTGKGSNNCAGSLAQTTLDKGQPERLGLRQLLQGSDIDREALDHGYPNFFLFRSDGMCHSAPRVTEYPLFSAPVARKRTTRA